MRWKARIFGVALATTTLVTAARADGYVLVGGGVLNHTEGGALMVASDWPGSAAVRAHFTRWDDNSTVTMAYDVYKPHPINVSLGAGIVRHRNGDLENSGTFYAELGFQVTRRFRCQFVHLSSTANDSGENFLFCGLAFGERAE